MCSLLALSAYRCLKSFQKLLTNILKLFFLPSVRIQKTKRVKAICYKPKVLHIVQNPKCIYLSFHSLIHLAKCTHCYILGNGVKVVDKADNFSAMSEPAV